MVGKGENAVYQHFLLFPQCFQKSYLLGVVKSRECVIKDYTLFSQSIADMVIQKEVRPFSSKPLKTKMISYILHLPLVSFRSRHIHNLRNRSFIEDRIGKLFTVLVDNEKETAIVVISLY